MKELPLFTALIFFLRARVEIIKITFNKIIHKRNYEK